MSLPAGRPEKYPDGSPMNIEELTAIIEAAGGGDNALEYAAALLAKVNRIEATDRYGALLKQLRSAGEPGDFRGRVLEVNFADAFVRNGCDLIYGARQGMTGDIDFQWNLSVHELFLEMKLLGQDRATKDAVNAQLERDGVSALRIADDTADIVRIQRDMIQKGSTRKFNPIPQSGWLNFVAIDVAELQLGTVDIADCLLAAGGNPVVSQYYDPVFMREKVVGVFEAPPPGGLTADQEQWIAEAHHVPLGQPHPRQYIHGALFLFREPKATAALSYDLTSVVVWNPALVTADVAQSVYAALHEVIPIASM
jgi:hypothetical protein